jgi:hypothetical protein
MNSVNGPMYSTMLYRPRCHRVYKPCFAYSIQELHGKEPLKDNLSPSPPLCADTIALYNLTGPTGLPLLRRPTTTLKHGHLAFHRRQRRVGRRALQLRTNTLLDTPHPAQHRIAAAAQGRWGDLRPGRSPCLTWQDGWGQCPPPSEIFEPLVATQ